MVELIIKITRKKIPVNMQEELMNGGVQIIDLINNKAHHLFYRQDSLYLF